MWVSVPWNSIRMSRVCHQWREVALEPRLWRTVNLSTSVLNIKTSPKILQTLATTRLKYTTHLSLEGWSKLTDKGIKVWLLLCSSRKNPYPPLWRSSEIPIGRGVSTVKILEAIKYETKLEFLGGRGVQNKTLPRGSMNVFSGTTI